MKLSNTIIMHVIRTVADADDQVTFGSDSSPAEIKVASMLMDEDYLTGDFVRNERGIPRQATAIGVTLSGFEYLEELRVKRFRSSWKGRSIAVITLIITYLAGVMSPVLSDAIKDTFKKPNANKAIEATK